MLMQRILERGEKNYEIYLTKDARHRRDDAEQNFEKLVDLHNFHQDFNFLFVFFIIQKITFNSSAELPLLIL